MWFSPAAIVRAVWPRVTSTGTADDPSVPLSPSCPNQLLPQHLTPPATIAQVCDPPAAIAVASEMPTTWTGRYSELEVAPLPVAVLVLREIVQTPAPDVGRAASEERHRRVVEKRYGLNGKDVATLEALARELGITRERVRQLQMEALARLRQRLAQQGMGVRALL